MADHALHGYREQLLTTGAKALNPIDSTGTTVPSNKGSNYAKVDDLYDSLGDLVNEQFRLWYYREFHRLGIETVIRLASIARQESYKDKRKHFSTLLKNN
jgi:hypothetical protein